MKYWKEHVEIGLDEAGLKATEEQVEILTQVIESGYEHYGQMYGHDCIPNPQVEENKRLTEKLHKEIAKRGKPFYAH